MDDLALTPVAPQLEYTPEQEDQIVLAEDTKIADAYFHPAWAKVERMFKEELVSYQQATDPSLPADEYKITDLANKRAELTIKRVLQRVQDAVTTVEQSKATKKRK